MAGDVAAGKEVQAARICNRTVAAYSSFSPGVVVAFQYFRGLAMGWLDHPVLPVPVTWITGVAIAAIGVAVAIWARMILNTNWSGVVALKSGHELIRKGPYRWIRHPIYTGILMAMIGTAMVRNQVRGWIGFAIEFATFYFKARKEEQFLRREFGAGFEEHSRHTGMFLPKHN
jgi:protein-S-isoprenylcysteine O-methyltransferase Ste14